jgi:hypothetical protein
MLVECEHIAPRQNIRGDGKFLSAWFILRHILEGITKALTALVVDGKESLYQSWHNLSQFKDKVFGVAVVVAGEVSKQQHGIFVRRTVV